MKPNTAMPFVMRNGIAIRKKPTGTPKTTIASTLNSGSMMKKITSATAAPPQIGMFLKTRQASCHEGKAKGIQTAHSHEDLRKNHKRYHADAHSHAIHGKACAAIRILHKQHQCQPHNAQKHQSCPPNQGRQQFSSQNLPPFHRQCHPENAFSPKHTSVKTIQGIYHINHHGGNPQDIHPQNGTNGKDTAHIKFFRCTPKGISRI